jgi:hypothetical protein
MRHSYKSAIACLLLFIIAALTFSASAFARGGGAANITGSPGYQRALQESRQRYRDSYSQPYTQPPSVYPRKKWRHRGRR